MLLTEITNFEEKEMITLTNKEIKSYEKQSKTIYAKKGFDMIKTRKDSEIIVITLENLKDLLIVNAM